MRDVQNDLGSGRGGVAVHGEVGADELRADVAEDSGAAGGDAVLSEEHGDGGEIGVNAFERIELRRIVAEDGREVCGEAVVIERVKSDGVFVAEAVDGIVDGIVTTAATESAVRAV
jgi:hypothetical protein